MNNILLYLDTYHMDSDHDKYYNQKHNYIHMVSCSVMWIYYLYVGLSGRVEIVEHKSYCVIWIYYIIWDIVVKRR